MARTANSARKQVAKKTKEKSRPKQADVIEKAADKLVEKIAAEKLVTKVLEDKKVIEKSQTPSSLSGKRPVKSTSSKSLSVSTPKISQKPNPKPNTRKMSANVAREIKYYQKNIGFLIPRAGVVRIIRSIILDNLAYSKTKTETNYKFTSASLDILHETLENYLVHLIELSYMAARHAKRVTLFASDIRLISRIKSDK